jgi:MoaA/NifB/PqqE/SkfB family radical SAM enzyme
MEKKKLRLIVTRECNRNCAGCCNNQDAYVESKIPDFDGVYEGYDEIMVTGGEPLIYPRVTQFIAVRAKVTNPKVKMILYTAEVSKKEEIIDLLQDFDGITVTLHDQKDVDDFRRLNFALMRIKTWIRDNNKTLRLNVFKGVDVYMQNDYLWKIRDNIEWIENCPLPEGETIMEVKLNFDITI